MATKSPTTAVKSREIIGGEQFIQRREVFDQHDTVFLPLPSPTTLVPASDVDPIVTSNHGKTTSNFIRNAPRYSSMRESTEYNNNFEYRPRKYSDNFTSEMHQNDDVDYRRTMTERTRRLSKLRRDFLTSNLHEPTNESPLSRGGVRSSMPAPSRSPSSKLYKIESPTIHKFPFAEPYSTPSPVRKVILDLGPLDIDVEKENKDPEDKLKHQSLPTSDNTTKMDHQKLFEELVKRYSPQRKPVDWKLPPTRPKIVGSVPKSTSSADCATEGIAIQRSNEKLAKSEDDDVFSKEANENKNVKVEEKEENNSENKIEIEKRESSSETVAAQNGPKAIDSQNDSKDKKERDSKISLTELAEKNDKVPELVTLQRQVSKESSRQPTLETMTDLSIPDLLDKMSNDGKNLENNSKTPKKVKRKRSFLDKLLGRNKRGENKEFKQS